MNILTRAAAGVMTVALMAAAMWLYERRPGLEDRAQKPLSIHGNIGAVVDTPDFSVRVRTVDVASAISKPTFPGKAETMNSLGLFVVVQLDDKSNQKPFRPGHVRLLTHGGVSYEETGRSEIPGENDQYEPMMWVPATYVFEIPKDRLAGVRLIMGESGLLNNLSAEAQVDLGIDGGRAARLAAHPAPAYVLKTT